MNDFRAVDLPLVSFPQPPAQAEEEPKEVGGLTVHRIPEMPPLSTIATLIAQGGCLKVKTRNGEFTIWAEAMTSVRGLQGLPFVVITGSVEVPGLPDGKPAIIIFHSTIATTDPTHKKATLFVSQ